MNNDQPINTNQAVKTAPAQVTSPAPTEPVKPEKSNKTLIVILSILLVISLAAGAVFAYLYFSNNAQAPTASNPTPETPISDEAEKEVDITDTYVLRDLDEKIAALHLATGTDPTIVLKNGTHPELQLYEDGNLSEAGKLMHAIYSLKGQFRYLNNEEFESARAQTGNYLEDRQGIDANIVEQKYKSIFGHDLVRPESYKYCPNYVYNSEYDFYFDWSMCGGTSPYNNYYYKYKYTTQGDNAYVYIAAATVAPTIDENNGYIAKEPYMVYCDVVKGVSYSSSKPEVCTTITESEANNFTINESNYQDFASYRFVFHKADDGTYYFDKVEQL